MFTAVRVAILVVAGLLFVGGAAALVAGGEAAASGIFPLLLGAAGMIAMVLERVRYRSETAEAARDSAGPGGGEIGLLEPRFRRTEEVFRDPTSGRQMRVYTDPGTGERRYLAES